jgi:hypothetical protein
MYYPYFRGKQFELLTIRRNKNFIKNSDIIPIIEPARADFSALNTCIKELNNSETPYVLVVNPSVGELEKDKESFSKILDNVDGVTKIAVIIKSNTDISAISTKLSASSKKLDVYFIHETTTKQRRELEIIANWAASVTHIASEKGIVRSYGDIFTTPQIIQISDPFANFKQSRNLDYENNNESIFTTSNLFYVEDGFVGYSDYLTIGKDFIEGGMLPKVVVINLTYRKDNDQNIYIQHFVSTNNAGTNADVAGKFYDALCRLIKFVKDEQLTSNIAIEKFRALYKDEKFPGLGSIKELSMTNHLFVAGDK